MTIFSDNIPLALFVCMTIGLVFGRYVGIIDGMQREQKAQARRNRIQKELRWEQQQKRYEQHQPFSDQVG